MSMEPRGCCNTREGAPHSRNCTVFGDGSPMHTYLDGGHHLAPIQGAVDTVATVLGVDAPALTFVRAHWALEDPFLDAMYRWVTVTEGGGRHRAESITDDITVDNVSRYRAYRANLNRTRNVGHLGVPGRHECRECHCGDDRFDRAFVSIVRASRWIDELLAGAL